MAHFKYGDLVRVGIGPQEFQPRPSEVSPEREVAGLVGIVVFTLGRDGAAAPDDPVGVQPIALDGRLHSPWFWLPSRCVYRERRREWLDAAQLCLSRARAARAMKAIGEACPDLHAAARRLNQRFADVLMSALPPLALRFRASVWPDVLELVVQALKVDLYGAKQPADFLAELRPREPHEQDYE